MAWKADLTVEVPVQYSRQQDRQRPSRKAGATVVLVLAILAVLYSRRGPVVSLPPGVVFGPQAVQSSSGKQSVLVTNNGVLPLHVQSAVITGDQAKDFELTDNDCPNSTIQPGQSCSIGIAFTPRLEGERNAVISLDDNASDSPQNLVIKGIGVRARLTVRPFSLEFGTQIIGVTSVQEVTIANVGTASVTVGEITVAGDGRGFSISENSCVQVEIPGGGICVVKVQFNPEVSGSQAAHLIVHDSSGDAPHEIPLSGSGTVTPSPVPDVHPSPLDFGTQYLESHSVKEVLVTNNGTAPLTIDATGVTGEGTGEFVLDNGCKGQILEPKQQCTIGVQFTPRAPGAHSAELTISDNGSNSPQLVALAGSGYKKQDVELQSKSNEGSIAPPRPPTGVHVSIHPEIVNFDEQEVRTTSASKPIMVTSVGDAAAEIHAVALQGKSSKDFEIRDSCVGKRLSLYESCTIDVTFTPASPFFARYPSTRGAELVLNTTGGSRTVALSGIAIRTSTPTAPSLQVSPTRLDFESTLVRGASRPQAVTLSNPNADAIRVSIQILDNAFTGLFTGKNSGDFRLRSQNCAQIPANGSCSVVVESTPQTAGNHNAYLTIVAAGGQFQSVRLSGTGYVDTPIQ
jgi:archaellum component FlaF (FlaF/FlaG flagellin family)